jgi:uncharacterized protein (DUF2235 family)
MSSRPAAITHANVLAECKEAERAWQEHPGRNLVLMFDGTGNILGNGDDTNVVKLLRLLQQGDPEDPACRQVVYYDPGVGTNNDFPPAGITSSLRSVTARLGGLAEGSGAFDNIADAYEFLCRTWRPGDRIYVFGFSRGAFTARAVGGMVNMYGLVTSAGLPLLRTLVRTYFAKDDERRRAFTSDIARGFSAGRAPLVHFTGVWDTVESIGLGGVKITNISDITNKRFVHVRHALAIHETRTKYRPRLYQQPRFTAADAGHRSFDQRWFRGVHSDIGGSYAEAGLSNVTLHWMRDQAEPLGLMLTPRPADAPEPNPPDPAGVMHDQVLESPFWAWAGQQTRVRDASPVDASALPISGATAPQRSQHAKGFVVLGWVLAVIVLLLGWKTWQAGAGACILEAPTWWQYVGSPAQLLAPWADEIGMSCDEDLVRHALAWDWAFLPAYALLLAYPMAWSVRRWIPAAIAANRALPWPARHVHQWMWVLVLADLLENAFAWWAPELVWIIAFFSLIKQLAVLRLLACVVISLFRRPAPTGLAPSMPAAAGGI